MKWSIATTLLTATAGILAAQAIPTDLAANPKGNVTTLSKAKVAAYKPFSWFASAGYCNPSKTLSWRCGPRCQANPDFIPVASGGDGSSTQYWFVGYSPAEKSVIVSHQGTNTSSTAAILIDLDVKRVKLDSKLFPGINPAIAVHSGFADEHAKTAKQVLAAVNATVLAHKASRVTTVGHSLGAALALLDGVYLPLHLKSVKFRTIGYGMPRVGNQAFANYVDAHLPLKHVNNKEDPVPVLPLISWGFVHPSGEVHIQDSGDWDACPGQDNPSPLCSAGDLSSIAKARVDDHNGPYDGVIMGNSC